MKKSKAIVFLTTLLSFTMAQAQTSRPATDYLHVPGPVVFQKKSYNLMWTSHPAPNYYKHEYLAAGDSFTRFQTMLLLDVVTGTANLKNVVTAKIAELKKMKETNPFAEYETFDNPKTGEYILSFLLTANTPGGKALSIAESNVYRYKTFTNKQGQTGVLLFGVSTRSYDKDIPAFLAPLKKTKAVMVTAVAEFAIPAVIISQ